MKQPRILKAAKFRAKLQILKIGTKMPDLSILGTIDIVKNEFLTHTVNFCTRSTFCKDSGMGPGPLYQICKILSSCEQFLLSETKFIFAIIRREACFVLTFLQKPYWYLPKMCLSK